MNHKLYLFFFLLALLGCAEKDRHYTTYTGAIVEQNSLNPINGLTITITDGNNKYSESTTNHTGHFSIDLAHNSSLGKLYLHIDGNGVYPSKNIELAMTVEGKYDYGLIYLYNQLDTTLYPKIENVRLTYMGNENVMIIEDVLIESECLLAEAFVEISTNEDFHQNDRYELEKKDDGTYSAAVFGLVIGERYWFRVVASNIVGTGRSETISRTIGMPIPSLLGLQNATINSATVRMNVSEEPLTTLRAGVCWSTTRNPTISDNIISGETSGTSDITIGGLDFRLSTCYVRAFAENANGVAYSEEMILPINNPYNLPTFTSMGNTYTYKYMGWGSWYTAYEECRSLVLVFDDWTLPSISILPDFFNAYCSLNNNIMPLPVWSMRKYEEYEDGESETFMLTYNGNIMAPKNQMANYYAVRKL